MVSAHLAVAAANDHHDEPGDSSDQEAGASDLRKVYKKQQSTRDKRTIAALQLQCSAPSTARFDPVRIPLRPDPRVKKGPLVDPNETTVEMVQRVQGQYAVYAVRSVQDDGTNLTGERGSQRFAEQLLAARWASVWPTRDAGSAGRSDDTPERPSVAERARATNLANVQRERELLAQQRRDQARAAQRVLDQQETVRANTQYEREKWGMTPAAWRANWSTDAAEISVAIQIADQDAHDLSRTPWRQAEETFAREMQESSEVADAANSLAEDARRNLEDAPRLAAERDAHTREVARLREIGQATEARIREERRLHAVDSRQSQRWRLRAGYQHPSPAVAQDGWDWRNWPNTGWGTSSWQTPWNTGNLWQAGGKLRTPAAGDWWTSAAAAHSDECWR